jgi:hypothetical protein
MAYDDNGPPMTITMVVCTVASFCFMSLRFYCKQALGTKVGIDDAVLALSWVCLLPSRPQRPQSVSSPSGRC